MEKEALLGSPSPEVSSPSLSAEMANFGSRLDRGPWFRPSESVEWDSDGLVQGQNAIGEPKGASRAFKHSSQLVGGGGLTRPQSLASS